MSDEIRRVFKHAATVQRLRRRANRWMLACCAAAGLLCLAVLQILTHARG